MFNARTLELIGTWRTTEETCRTTVSHGSDLSRVIRCVIVLVALFRKEQRGIRVAGV
jgi:hypothetical protein